jgi:hypothetical protein
MPFGGTLVDNTDLKVVDELDRELESNREKMSDCQL